MPVRSIIFDLIYSAARFGLVDDRFCRNDWNLVHPESRLLKMYSWDLDG